MRSLLMVPAHKQRCLDKCLHLKADGIVFDLEDSVPVGLKSAALELLYKFLRRNAGLQAYVRVNPTSATEEIMQLQPYIHGVMLPKARTVFDIPLVCRQMPTLLVIETAMAIVNLEGLLGENYVKGAVFGVGDYSADMGVIDRPWVGDVNQRFMFAKQKLATVARAYGKMALDTSFFVKGLNTAEETRKQWSEVASWGFTGASPIHPAQIPIANEVFSTSVRERIWSQKVVEGTKQRAGEVWVDPEGFVVGPPHVKQTRGKV